MGGVYRQHEGPGQPGLQRLLVGSTDWTSILAIVRSALLVTSDYSLWSLTNLISVLGVTTVTPVMPQMMPNSVVSHDAQRQQQSRQGGLAGSEARRAL